MNATTFERDLCEVFEGGAIRRRELRLDGSEAAHLRGWGACVTALAPSGDKFWYEISFPREDMKEKDNHS